MKKTLFVFFVMAFLLVGLVSALTFYNIEDLDTAGIPLRVKTSDGCRGTNFTSNRTGTITNFSIEWADKTGTGGLYDIHIYEQNNNSVGVSLGVFFNNVTTNNGNVVYDNISSIINVTLGDNYWWCVYNNGPLGEVDFTKLEYNAAWGGRRTTSAGLPPSADVAGACSSKIWVINISGGGPPPPNVSNTINLSAPFPVNGSLFNTAPIRFNVTGNFSLDVNNCSLIINGSVNQTTYNFTNLSSSVLVNYSIDVNITDGHYVWFISCEDAINQSNTSVHNFTFDLDPPVIKDDFVNNTLVFNNNITGQFNLSDALLLHSLNVTIDGSTIFNITHIHLTNYTYNLSYNVTGLSVGRHTLVVKVADGHTLSELREEEAYNPSNGLFNDYIRYDFRSPYKEMFVKTRLLEDSLLDSWSTEFLGDRYSETFIPSTPGDTQVFLVESDKRIYVADVGEAYGGSWLIIGEHWRDFVLRDEPGSRVKIRLLDDFTAEVTVSGIVNSPEKLVFDSIGDLNIVNVTYDFYRVNLTETFSSFLLSNVTASYNLSVDFDELFFDIIGVVPIAIMDFNGTNISASLDSFSNLSANFSLSFVAPSVNFSEVVNHHWYFNFSNLTSPPLVTLSQSQIIYGVAIGVCSDPVNHTVVRFSYFDEISLDSINLTNTYDLVIYDGTFYYNQTNNTFVRNETNKLCTNIDPAVAVFNWDLWGSFILSEPDYVTRVVDFEEAAPISISNSPQTNVSFFLVKVANSSTVTFNWLTQSFQLIDGTMRVFRCEANGTRNLVASTSVISGITNVNLELLTAAYAYDIIIGGLVFSDLAGYSKCHVESQTSITYFVDIGGVDVTPVIGLAGIPCLLNRSASDVVTMSWGANPEDSSFVQGCLGAYVSNIYGVSLVQENCSVVGDGFVYQVDFGALGLTDYVVVGELRQSGSVSVCGSEVAFRSTTPAQATSGITFLLAAFLIVAAMILFFAGDGEVQLVGGMVGLIGVAILGLLNFSVVVIVSLIMFLLLILVIGRATRRRT